MNPENHSNSLPFWPVFEFGIAWGTPIENRFFFFLIDEELKKKMDKKRTEHQKLFAAIDEISGHYIKFDKNKIDDEDYVRKICEIKLRKYIWEREKIFRKKQ